ncbi:MAG: hypothetical protein MUC84_11005 [Solirubrobacteraceae bacterium]|jgi:hypothetical protein|nr:hypothetical protein [Solirubrobacteraceae bacterium]
MTSNPDRATGWWVFAGIILGVAGILNVIYGIAAIDNATFFTENAKYIVSDLSTWGWVTLIIGVIQLFAAASLFTGGGFGRWIGIFAAAASAIAALLSIPGNPFWSLAIFALALIVLYELAKPSRA